MIEGHGDDAYKYKAIKINFSSNVYNHVDHSGLHQHLFQQMESIRTYPEPEPYSLEKVLAMLVVCMVIKWFLYIT